MNQRIQQLYKQAHITQEKQVRAGGWDNDREPFEYRTVTETNFDPEKFAELIVKECADICINKNVSNIDLDVIRESGKFTLQDLATKSCGENLSKQIKQHFGVEE